MLTLHLRFALLTALFVNIRSQSPDEVPLQGDNVCTMVDEHEEVSFEKQERIVTYHTTEWCGDISQGFRCKVSNNATKVSYSSTPKKKQKIVKGCCIGFFRTENATCEICPSGFFGMNCTLRCENCTEKEICSNEVGCCDPNTDRCRYARSASLSEPPSGNGWLLGILIASLLGVALLLFGMIFYRKKYMKEKDPDLPTLTYHPRVKEFLPASEIESREFNNPLYRQSALPNNKLTYEEEVAARSKLRSANDNSGNEYATLDEMGVSLAGPSSREPLLRDRTPYEVPSPSRQIPSPESRDMENNANEKREEVA